ncbi:hypothetical protein [Miltoncostaea oceani]|uniref:hypothetical protein n=1 Tax=Miltoncostaea oceani TaxID=2843216 RepID=UPI001C3C3C88|nr:hypothetical protein [Miltoncostaea oceani]
MPRYVLRAVPWRLVAACGLVIPCLMALTAAWPDVVWPLQGTAVGLLAAAAAWSMDEPAAAVVDSLPRGLAWRTAARSAAVVPLAVVWTASVVVAGDRLPDHAALFVLQGLAAILAGVAVATTRRAAGVATPGLVLAPAVLAVVAMLALVRPMPDRLPFFPLWEGEEAWARSATIWWSILAAAAVVLVASLARDGRRRPSRVSSCRPGPGRRPPYDRVVAPDVRLRRRAARPAPSRGGRRPP